MFADIYAIQTVPPSNINRDDTGSPKTAYYGGVLRARVSSQAWKRAMREMFQAMLPEGSLGVRTKLAASLVGERIANKREDLVEESARLGEYALTALGIKVSVSDRAGSDEGKPMTGYLVFISHAELDLLADLAIKWFDQGEIPSATKKATSPTANQKKEAERVCHGTRAVDIALFGRMLADAPQLNVDAASQVAHAISVDRVRQDYDYFTAVDDCVSEDNAGAAMIDTVSFNSSTLYRYATVDVDSLYAQLGDVEVTARSLEAFAEAFVRSMPSGKQNTFANRTLPSAVVVSLRPDQPINAVSAFETPVRAEGEASVASIAARRLGATIGSFEQAYDMPAKRAWNVVVGDSVPELDAVSEHVDMHQLLSDLHDEVLASLVGGE